MTTIVRLEGRQWAPVMVLAIAFSIRKKEVIPRPTTNICKKKIASRKSCGTYQCRPRHDSGASCCWYRFPEVAEATRVAHCSLALSSSRYDMENAKKKTMSEL
ncbi:unnamed protein product [Linum tenue]|uniref:Secreted protein n=1 Tax=Linum tenue TaxID=586396 RepID=A0AAV0IVJ7_9ROSI|nr:unnamed protein product [Linum tenue]